MVKPKPKQMEPRCLCGQAIKIPKRKNEARCKHCGVRWERGPEGFWALGITRFLFTPYLAKLRERKDKPNRYDRYMEWRNANSPKRRRKVRV